MYDKTLNKLDRLGVSWDREKLKLRRMHELLDSTKKLNVTVSNTVLRKFKHEMSLRKEKLAFLMDKVYFITKHEKDVYNSLA